MALSDAGTHADGPAAGAPAAVVLGSLAAPVDPALDELLGQELTTELRALLAARARRWAAAVAPDRAFEATTAEAASVAVHGHDGPVLLAAPDVPGLDTGLAAAALADLEDGAALVVAPALDGRPFLIGLPRADPALFELVGASFEDVLAAVGAAAGESGFGMLRSERRLVTPADAQALAADPVAPAELAQLLARVLDVRSPP